MFAQGPLRSSGPIGPSYLPGTLNSDRTRPVCLVRAMKCLGAARHATGTVIDINGARLRNRGGGPALSAGPPFADQP